MAIDAGEFEILVAYPEVVNFLLRTQATNEVVTESHTDVVSFRQGSKRKAESYPKHL